MFFKLQLKIFSSGAREIVQIVKVHPLQSSNLGLILEHKARRNPQIQLGVPQTKIKQKSLKAFPVSLSLVSAYQNQ